MPGKRTRTNGGYKAARPIDKALVAVTKSSLSAAQSETDIVTATGACTVTGLRWSINAYSVSAAGGLPGAHIYWALVLVPDGYSASTLSGTDAGNLYEPEQHVLAFGSVYFDSAASLTADGKMVAPLEGSTKSMRKLKSGDKVKFIILPTTPGNETISVRAVVQAFCME